MKPALRPRIFRFFYEVDWHFVSLDLTFGSSRISHQKLTFSAAGTRTQSQPSSSSAD